jgi:branched-chain amino acid transport system substrate-binding protein
LLRAARAPLRADVVLHASVSETPGSIAAGSARVVDAGCLVVLWGGDSTGGAELRRQLVEDGLASATVVGGDRMKDDIFLEASGPDGEGSLATCPCVDRSTSTDLASQRFIQDYQAEYGLPPGPYAAEAWDVARLFVSTFRAGATTREEVRRGVDAIEVFDGLGGPYRFRRGGDLAPGTAVVRVYRDEGGRWISISR